MPFEGGEAPIRRGGVADYFAILGVGDKLTWKHRQKQSHPLEENHEAAPSDPEFGLGVGSGEEDEDDAGQLEERFMREIVEVSIVCVEEETSAASTVQPPSSAAARVTGSVAEALSTSSSWAEKPSSVIGVSVVAPDITHIASYRTESSQDPSVDSQNETGAPARNLPLHHLPSSPSTHSEATTNATSVNHNLGGPEGVGRTGLATYADSIKVEHNGWNVIMKTLPAAHEGMGLPPHEEVDDHSWNTTSTRVPQLWSKSTVWDANVDYKTGLQAEIQRRQETVPSHHHRVQPFTGLLRRKMESTFKHLTGRKFTLNPKFYVSFRRRQDLDQPAIADVQLFHVRFHHESLPHMAKNNHNISFPGLAGQLFERYQPQMKVVSRADQVEQEEDESKLALTQDFLTLPPGFDEWSIPREFSRIRDPRTRSSSPRPADSSSRTVIFSHDDEGTQDSSSGMGVEAIEATSDNAAVDPDSLFPRLITDGYTGPNGPENDHFSFVPVVAIRRQRLSDEERYLEDTGIVDLAVSFLDRSGAPVLPNESLEDDEEEEDKGIFHVLGKTEWSHVRLASCNTNGMDWPIKKLRMQLGTPVLLFRKNIPYGFADAAFATRVLDRFPERNYKGLPLPEEELPMFCYPTGCRLHRAQFSDAPLSQYYGFVVKNERGDSIYISCVSFFEPLTKDKVSQLAKMSEKRQRTSLPHRYFCERMGRRLTKDKEEGEGDSTHSTDITVPESDHLLTGFDEMTTFETKTICIVSRNPFWTAFRRFLSNLHILSGSSSQLPLERYISHLLLSVPLPRPGGPNILLPMPALSEPMVLSVPPEKDFPLIDLPYHRLFACLQIKTVVTAVLGLLALERKVIVMSIRPSLVLDVCELLRSLLFPFELCAPYVPRLTEPFKSSLDFPGAIFVGIHDDGSSSGLAATVRNAYPEESIIIDLDSGRMDCDGDRYEIITKSWEMIPESSRSALVSELETLCRDAGIVDGQEPLDSQYDAAFDVAVPSAVEDVAVSNISREPLDDRAIRDAFLRFFCAVLGGYERYLVVPDADFLVSGNEWFDSQGFLASVPTERAAYVSSLVHTQLFQSFIQRRTEASDVHCLLFDECVAEFHSSAVPYGRLGGDVEAVTFEEHGQPQMMYSLLVDQSASFAAHDRVITGNVSTDESEGGSSANISKVSQSLLMEPSLKYSETAINVAGDIVMAPSRRGLPTNLAFIYCVDGNPCFPHKLNYDLCLPRAPDSWLVEMYKSPAPRLSRSERELEEAHRQRKQTTSHRGIHNQRRCLWQLPKLMGSQFLGSWLLCIPAQVAQAHLSHEQQSRYLCRALGALRLLRSKQRIVPDEAAYRTLMVACGRTRSDRRVELVKLFGLLRSDGIFPSAVTLGQYTRALAEGYSKRSSGAQQEDDGYGVEVSESGSRIGRSSFASASFKGNSGLESSLAALDGNLATLETHGRRWRQRQGADKDNTDRNAQDEESKRKKHGKSWLPVVLSSSFLPTIGDIDENDVRLVAMWSRTRSCANCSYIPLEEEVQAGWDVAGGENEVPGAVACPCCGSLFVPMLGYREMSLDEANGLEINSSRSMLEVTADFGELPPQISPIIQTDLSERVSYVTYISPATLRLSLEQIVEEQGEGILDRDRLREHDPEIFYNFWWYCARFSLPLPLTAEADLSTRPVHMCALAAWERSVAERGCYSAAKVVVSQLESKVTLGASTEAGDELEFYCEHPLLSRFNLQGYYSGVWDHQDLCKILVALVEACDKRDFKPVVETVLKINQRRREKYGMVETRASSEVNYDLGAPQSSDLSSTTSPSVELDVYRTMLYLAKYQCASAFHQFFPATLKACKGYHFWCAIGTPMPTFDWLFREGVKRIYNSRDSKVIAPPLRDVSEVALSFRCVFGHLI